MYKKGDTDDQANFRPITLQPVWYSTGVIFELFSSSAISNFMIDYIDQNLQKGFWKGVDGVTEHTE